MEGDARIASAWATLEADWANPEAHRRFLAFCGMQGALAEAGRRYREVRDHDPVRRDEAERWLGRVLASAVEQLSLTRTPRPPKQRRMVWLMVGTCGFFLVYALLTLLRARSH